MSSDFLIVGSGIAGLFLAEKLSRLGAVTLVTKKKLVDANTTFAQGGIAAVRDFENDSIEKHIQDTLQAGSFHNNPEAVKFLAQNADQAIRELNDYGIIFDPNPTREGGHSFSRIWHKDDFSGEYVEENLILRVQKNAQINLWDHTYAFDLIISDQNTCAGILVEDHNHEIHPLQAKYTILACGGAGYLFAKTTNPSVTVGEGIALAVRHNVEVADLEFIQFHPTVLDIEREPMFLLSEALRGEGAKIVDANETEFMWAYHPLGNLSPRDIVTRAICNEQKKGQIYLDIRHKSAEFLRERFPNISHELRRYGLKLERDLIPITPAAHYTCGGIKTDLQGRTSLPNLFAVGEVACTGVHGANRLASNSLLEGVVFGQSIYEQVASGKRQVASHKLDLGGLKPQGDDNFQTTSNGVTPLAPLDRGEQEALPITSSDYPVFLQKIRAIMWQDFGIIRRRIEMEEGIAQLQKLQPQDVQSQNAQNAALAIAKSCLKRKESLGCHWVSVE